MLLYTFIPFFFIFITFLTVQLNSVHDAVYIISNLCLFTLPYRKEKSHCMMLCMNIILVSHTFLFSFHSLAFYSLTLTTGAVLLLAFCLQYFIYWWSTDKADVFDVDIFYMLWWDLEEFHWEVLLKKMFEVLWNKFYYWVQWSGF